MGAETLCLTRKGHNYLLFQGAGVHHSVTHLPDHLRAKHVDWSLGLFSSALWILNSWVVAKRYSPNQVVISYIRYKSLASVSQKEGLCAIMVLKPAFFLVSPLSTRNYEPLLEHLWGIYFLPQVRTPSLSVPEISTIDNPVIFIHKQWRKFTIQTEDRRKKGGLSFRKVWVV